MDKIIGPPDAWHNDPNLKPKVLEWPELSYRQIIAACYEKTGKTRDDCHLECCDESCEGEGCANCGPDV